MVKTRLDKNGKLMTNQIHGDRVWFVQNAWVKELVEKHVLTPTSFVLCVGIFGHHGKNFITMQNLLRLTRHLQSLMTNMVVQLGHVLSAELMTHLAENRRRIWLLPLSNDAVEDTTWYDFG